jgi:hypothetical protein
MANLSPKFGGRTLLDACDMAVKRGEQTASAHRRTLSRGECHRSLAAISLDYNICVANII